MTLLDRISQRFRRDFFRHLYRRTAKQILQTPPINKGKENFILLSMMHTRDLLSYLVAVKSFASRINPQRIVMVCDPTVSPSDRLIVTEHVPHIEFRDADEFVAPEIPRGGTWERIYAISEYAKKNYVVQLDADTITCADLPEVASAIANGSGFVLGETPGQGFLSLAETRANALPKRSPDAHIQTLAEAAIAEIGLPETARYVRGCSGFTGFPSTPDMRDDLLDFSSRMKHCLGEGWGRWGTEQVTSNYLVANVPTASVLPFPEYGTPDLATEASKFLHFIGSMRFVNSKYEARSRQAIDSLKQTAR